MIISEPISAALAIAGTELAFANFYSIYGLLGVELSTLRDGEDSIYQGQRKDFSFNCSTSDIKFRATAEGDIFFTADSTYRYQFSVEALIPDMTGWTKVICILLGYEAI